MELMIPLTPAPLNRMNGVDRDVMLAVAVAGTTSVEPVTCE